MADPVVAADGHTYDRVHIEQHLALRKTSPMTNTPMPNTDLVPNFAMRSIMADLIEQFGGLDV